MRSNKFSLLYILLLIVTPLHIKAQKTNDRPLKVGKISIISFPENGAEVFVDEELKYSKTPINNRPIKAGKRTITLKKEGFLSKTKKIQILKDKNQNITFHMEPDSISLWKEDRFVCNQQKKTWFYSTIIAAGAGFYFDFQGNELYQSYKNAESAENANELHGRIENYNKIYPAFYGIASVCFLKYLHKEIKFSKANRKIKSRLKLDIEMSPSSARFLMKF